jgi:hypothetical protein
MGAACDVSHRVWYPIIVRSSLRFRLYGTVKVISSTASGDHNISANVPPHICAAIGTLACSVPRLALHLRLPPLKSCNSFSLARNYSSDESSKTAARPASSDTGNA